MSRKTVLRAKLNRHLPESQKMPTHSGPIHQLRGDQPWHIFRQTNSNISHVRIGSVRLGRALRAAKQLARFDRSDYFVAFAKLDANGAYVVDPMSKRHYSVRPHPELKAIKRRAAEQEAIERKRQEAAERRRKERDEPGSLWDMDASHALLAYRLATKLIGAVPKNKEA